MSIGVDPVVVLLGSLAVRWYGVLALVGLGVGLWLTLRAARRQRIAGSEVLRVLSWALPLGVISARLAFVLGWWDYYLVRPSELWQLPLSELSVWGGLAGGGLAATVVLRHNSALRRGMFNAAAPGVALAIAIAGVGAFVDGRGQGVPSDMPWATTYTSRLSSTPDFGIPRHPTQVYEALLALGLFVVLARIPFATRATAFVALFAAGRLLLSGVHLEPAFLFGLQIEAILAMLLLVAALWSGLRQVRTITPVTMFMKPGCHLCEVALQELERLQRRYPHRVELVDIGSDPALLEQFGERIPVLRVGGRDYAAPLMPATLERALQSHAS
jgi:phosphatidylglycerol:prolipoprotein diacylglycerol transferase